MLRRSIAAAAALAVLTGAACSSEPSETGSGDGSRVAQEEGRRDGKARERSPGGKKGGGGAEEPGSGDKGAAPAAPEEVPGEEKREQPAQAAEGFAPEEPSPVDPSLARRSATCEEPQPDAETEGLAPQYAEVVSGRIEGLGEDLRMTVTYRDAVPQKMPDDKTYMVIGWALAPGGNEAYGFSAQGGKDGWRAYAGGKGEATEFPGTLKISGNSIIMEIPWDFIEGPRSFNWQVNSTWFRSLANTTHYAFDPCPNDEAAKFPN